MLSKTCMILGMPCSFLWVQRYFLSLFFSKGRQILLDFLCVSSCDKTSQRKQKISALTHCILVGSSTVICWARLFVILGVLGLFSHFYTIFKGKPCQQTMQTLISRHSMWRLIWVCTVCLGSFNRFPGKNGLNQI